MVASSLPPSFPASIHLPHFKAFLPSPSHCLFLPAKGIVLVESTTKITSELSSSKELANDCKKQDSTVKQSTSYILL
jgi:hypothetical protein